MEQPKIEIDDLVKFKAANPNIFYCTLTYLTNRELRELCGKTQRLGSQDPSFWKHLWQAHQDMSQAPTKEVEQHYYEKNLTNSVIGEIYSNPILSTALAERIRDWGLFPVSSNISRQEVQLILAKLSLEKFTKSLIKILTELAFQFDQFDLLYFCLLYLGIKATMISYIGPGVNEEQIDRVLEVMPTSARVNFIHKEPLLLIVRFVNRHCSPIRLKLLNLWFTATERDKLKDMKALLLSIKDDLHPKLEKALAESIKILPSLQIKLGSIYRSSFAENVQSLD